MKGFSQVCPTGRTVCQHKDSPTVSYPQGKRLSDVEKLSAEATTAKLNANNIPVTGVLCDGSGQLTSVLKKHNIGKLECVEDLSRGTRGCKDWSDGFLDQGVSNEAKKAVSVAVRKWTSMELSHTRKKYPNDDTKFLQSTEKARQNIVPCLPGDHSKCWRLSLVCRSKSRQNKRLVPQLDLSAKDAKNMQEVVDYKLEKEKVAKQGYLLSTNKVEAFYLWTFALSPKSKLYKTMFHARCLNCVWLDRHATAVSMVKLGRAKGLD